jgi:3-dehydroquinate synthetase
MQRQQVLRFDTPLTVSSPYYFGDGIAEQFPGCLKEYEFDRCFLVTSEKLLQLLGEPLLRALRQAGVPCVPVLVPESEAQKSWGTLSGLCEELVARGATRDSILLALGGGVIGNVVGLAAALLYRGVRFVEVPTTVLAQTDSTLSNKQAINGSRGKNQFGVYHAPLFIWADAAYPRSEPERQQRSGIVEGVKNVLIAQEGPDALAHLLEAWRSGDRHPELLLRLIESKLAILREDPTERGRCVILEYGHTFGHAVEWLAGGKLFHGEAVSIGMCLAAELSHALGLQPESLLRDHYHLLGELLGAPTRLPEDIRAEALYETMLADNKRSGKGLRYLLLRDWGEFVNPDGDYMVSVPREDVLAMLRRVTRREQQVPTEA